MMEPRSSSMTRRRIVSTMERSWVAMSTVVPVRLMRSSSGLDGFDAAAGEADVHVD